MATSPDYPTVIDRNDQFELKIKRKEFKKMPRSSLVTELQLALSLSDEKLYEHIGQDVVRGALPSDIAKKVKEWLDSQREWIQKNICDNEMIKKAIKMDDLDTLSYAVALALMPLGSEQYAFYAKLGVLIARIGLDVWCDKEE